MADKLRIIKTNNTTNNSNLKDCSTESLIINTGGGLYLGNGSSAPTLISDKADGNYLKLSGGTLTGSLVLTQKDNISLTIENTGSITLQPDRYIGGYARGITLNNVKGENIQQLIGVFGKAISETSDTVNYIYIGGTSYDQPALTIYPEKNAEFANAVTIPSLTSNTIYANTIANNRTGKEVIFSEDKILSLNGLTGSKGLYNSITQNVLAAANKIWNVTGTITDSSGNITTINSSDIAKLFNGDYESQIRTTAGSTVTISIGYGEDNVNSMFVYGAGSLMVSFYTSAYKPQTITGRVYGGYSGSKQWRDITFELIDGYSATYIASFNATAGTYLSGIEITYTAKSDTEAWITEIEHSVNRLTSYNLSVHTKYRPIKSYYDVVAPNFIGNLIGQSNSSKLLSHNDSSDYSENSLQYRRGSFTQVSSSDAIRAWRGPYTGTFYGSALRLNYSTNYHTDVLFDANNFGVIYTRSNVNNSLTDFAQILTTSKYGNGFAARGIIGKEFMDFNDCLLSGGYCNQSGSNTGVINGPGETYGMLLVARGTSNYFPCQIHFSTSGVVKFRLSTSVDNTSWQSWKQLASQTTVDDINTTLSKKIEENETVWEYV